MLKCTSCQIRFKSHVITRCYHLRALVATWETGLTLTKFATSVSSSDSPFANASARPVKWHLARQTLPSMSTRCWHPRMLKLIQGVFLILSRARRWPSASHG